MLIFSKRKRLADMCENWCAENGIEVCNLTMVSYLVAHDLIDEAAALKFLKENENGSKT